MPTTLSKGYKVPLNGERGWWQTLIDNIIRLNGHSHNGTDSEKISSANLQYSTALLNAIAWTSVPASPGTFKQTVTLPSGMTFPSAVMTFYIEGDTGHQVFPEIQKVTSNTYDLFVNDNSLVLRVVYG